MSSIYVQDPDALGHIAVAVKGVTDQVLDMITVDAKRYAPVDTGDLRDSIHADYDKSRVVAEMDYAATQELGSIEKNIPAQPYLKPALYKSRRLK